MPLVIAPLNVELAILRIAVDEKDKKHTLCKGGIHVYHRRIR